jgi:hypothetical protein
MLGLQAVNPCLPSALIPSTLMSAAEFGIGHSAYKLRCMVDASSCTILGCVIIAVVS